jgi:hypothetical protein
MSRSNTPAAVRVEPSVRPPAGPNMRRILRAARLCQELGHGGDTLAAMEHMKRMESALKVLHTWAAFPPLDVREVRALCARALTKD